MHMEAIYAYIELHSDYWHTLLTKLADVNMLSILNNIATFGNWRKKSELGATSICYQAQFQTSITKSMYEKPKIPDNLQNFEHRVGCILPEGAGDRKSVV